MARAKKKADGAKRVKDLDPKGKAKNVKGGRTSVVKQVGRISERVSDRVVGRTLSNTGERVERLGQGIEKGTAPR